MSLIKGNKYVVTNNNLGWFAKGAVVVFSGKPSNNGNFEFIGPYGGSWNYTEIGKEISGFVVAGGVKPYDTPIQTLSQKCGYKVGDKFKVTGGTWFEIGAIVTLHEDDGTKAPYFINVHGEVKPKELGNVTPYIEPVLTPFQKLGYKPGDKFIGINGPAFKSGEVFVLSQDDGTDTPYFKGVETGIILAKKLVNIKPYVKPKTLDSVHLGTEREFAWYEGGTTTIRFASILPEHLVSKVLAIEIK